MRLCLVVILAAGLLGCTKHRLPQPTQPAQLCREGRALGACRTPAEVEALLAQELDVVAVSTPSRGKQGTRVVLLRTRGPDPVVFRAKWRAHSTTSATNNPRFELAAYALQKLFLSPSEYVVPPTMPYCFPLEQYRDDIDESATETFPHSGCVYGVLSYWLEGVTTAFDAHTEGWLHGLHRHLLDLDLMRRDAAYRDSLARVNLLTYLMRHGDTHSHNFVIERSGSERVAHTVYSIDNSKSLTLPKNRKIEPRHDWSKIMVPSFPHEAIERLRSADVSVLSRIAVMEQGKDRLIARRRDAALPFDGLEWSPGRLVIGLTEAEIAGVRARIDELLARVDRHELALY